MGDFDKAVFAIARLIKQVGGGSAVVAALQFSAPRATATADRVTVTGALAGAMSDKAARIAVTGAPLTIRYHGSIVARSDGRAWTSVSTRVLRYDSTRRTYVVTRDETPTEARSLDAASALFSSYAMVFPRPDPREELDFEVRAYLSYPSTRGDTTQVLWDYSTPYMRVRDLHRMFAAPAP